MNNQDYYVRQPHDAKISAMIGDRDDVTAAGARYALRVDVGARA